MLNKIASANKENYSEEVSAAELPADIQRFHNTSADCEDWKTQAGGNQKASKIKLDANRSAYIVPCFFGDYNFISKLYVVGKSGETVPQLFAEGDATEGWRGTDLLVNAHYDPGSRLLSSFSKGRGLGDCGSAGTWRWTDGRFVMREFWAWADCSNGRRPEK